MFTRPLKLVKDGQTVVLTEQAHIDAYKAKGWQVAPAAPAPRAKKSKEA